MLPGIGGSLIASAFLEDVFLKTVETHPSDEQLPQRLLIRWWRRVEATLGPASSPRVVLDLGALPLMRLLGYDVIHLEPHGSGFVGTLGCDRTALVVLGTTGFGDDPDRAWRDLVRAGRLSGVRWGFIYSGPTLRLIDARRAWARRALDFEFSRALGHQGSTTLLLSLTSKAALEGRDHGRSLDRVVRNSDAHSATVCASLSEGVIESLDALVAAFDVQISGQRQPPEVAFRHSLTLVYRLLFLLFAEARNLVPTANRVYRDAYTVEALWRRTTAGGRPLGLWKAIQAMSRLAHSGCRAGDLQVTAFNGRLFSSTDAPHIEHVRVPDDVVSRAVMALATTATAHGRRRISYADLGVEQLGSVYERVLEYEPRRSSGLTVLVKTSEERKQTGSFYTPRAITEFLVRRTLHPLVENKTADEIFALRVLDPAMGSGAFLVATCRYLATAVERALAVSGEWHPDGGARAKRVAIRRTIAERCLYGVDRNAMAVQLARLSLWLTTLADDRPLTFLDHHLAAGDSLIGVGFADLARGSFGQERRRPSAARRTQSLFSDDTATELARHVLPERFRLAIEPGDSLSAVREKERVLEALSASGTVLDRWKRAADLWCTAALGETRLTSAIFGDVLASLMSDSGSLAARDREQLLAGAVRAAHEHGFFHWELEFPEVFFDRDGRPDPFGGFDAVIGNPPWDALRADSVAGRDRSGERAWQRASVRFFRDGGVYRLQGQGHLNRYQLFAERALQLTRPGGRIGLVLPSGLATDRGSGPLRRAFLDHTTVDRLIGFSNRDGIFPIHRDVRFLLLTSSKSGSTVDLDGVFGCTQSAWLEDLPDAATADPPAARHIKLNRDLLERWDPEHLSIPLLSSPADLDLLRYITASVPPLGAREGWGVQFGRELNATEDRPHFIDPGTTPDTNLIIVVEGKHLEPFRTQSKLSRRGIPRHIASRLLDSRRTFDRPRLAYRDVASTTNRLTLIAALVPAGVVTTHTVFCMKTLLGDQPQCCLLGLLNSLVANFLVRLHITTHVTSTLIHRLPVPRPHGRDAAFRDLARLARGLSQTGIEGDEESYLCVNTLAATLYGLSQTQYAHVVGTFPLLSEELRTRLVAHYLQASEAQRLRGK